MPEPASPPSDDDRRHAACLAMGSAPGLIRFAARYTRSLHDAEDAYQRAMEIALTRAPVTEQRRFMAWLHTVLRNEALAVARVRRREGPGVEADVTEAYENTLEAAVRIDALAEWRERYRSIQDGLAGLTDAQRICLDAPDRRRQLRADPRDHGVLVEEGGEVGARGPVPARGLGGAPRFGGGVRAARPRDRARGLGTGDCEGGSDRLPPWAMEPDGMTDPAGAMCVRGSAMRRPGPPMGPRRLPRTGP